MFSLARLKFEFPNITRTRGLEYHQEKRVSLLEQSDQSATFNVLGEKKYQVVVQVPKGQRVTATCTCQYFKDGHKCKHIWATYLYVDQNQVFEAKQTSSGQDENTSPEKENGGWIKTFSSFLNSEEKHESDINHFLADAHDLKSEKLRSGVYVINAQKSKLNDKVFLSLLCQEFKQDGSLSVIKNLGESEETLALHGDPLDQEILTTLLGPTKEGDSGYYSRSKTNTVSIQPRSLKQILTQITQSGRLYIDFTKYSYSNTYENVSSYQYLPQDYDFVFELVSQSVTGYSLTPSLRNRETGEKISTDKIQLFISDLVFCEKTCFHSNYSKFANWMKVFKSDHALSIPHSQIHQFLEIFYKQPDHPDLILPSELGIQKINVQPKLKIYFEQVGESFYEVKLNSSYNDYKIENNKGSTSFYDSQKNQIVERDPQIEQQMRQQVLQLLYSESAAKKMQLSAKMILGMDALKDILPSLLKLEHEIYIQSAKVKKLSNLDLKLTNHMDWFDLELAKTKKADLTTADLPELLKSIQEDSGFVKIKDQVFLLPDEISKKLKMISRFTGQAAFDEQGRLKLSKVQSLFISSVLEQETESKTQVNREVFQGLLQSKMKTSKDGNPTKMFQGELRPYQKLGVGWLSKLHELGFGGLLADDMGLGKTVQVIAFLSKIQNLAPLVTKTKKATTKTTAAKVLIACPKSLIFNWQDEFAKFAPEMKVLCYQGKNRQTLLDDIVKYDIVITTYHSLRQDIQLMRDYEFEAFIVDEAQNIKNSESQVSMACRMVKAKHVYALTGTPVENSIQDFFSIMNVVLPGLFTPGKNILKYGNDDIQLLGRAFAPFILRRKKQDVLKDLPEKSEQVLYCELSPEEKQRYEELKNYYWSQLKGVIDQQGMNRSKIQILEALLRLRQASCHIGLLDQTKRDFVSAKFELLLEQIQEIVAEGHKVLVFSQFTQLLELFKYQLNQLNLPYHYLDGQTKDRKEIVSDFQMHDDKKVFLLSLKAGGVGLNLTAAEYVFILDPWWNPAVESQAIDRAHRIGQTKKVFAYKMIAKDTVEEKILKLQETKKDLLENLLSQKQSVLKNMTFEEIAEIFA